MSPPTTAYNLAEKEGELRILRAQLEEQAELFQKEKVLRDQGSAVAMFARCACRIQAGVATRAWMRWCDHTDRIALTAQTLKLLLRYRVRSAREAVSHALAKWRGRAAAVKAACRLVSRWACARRGHWLAAGWQRWQGACVELRGRQAAERSEGELERRQDELRRLVRSHVF
jgi:hypothetical protein